MPDVIVLVSPIVTLGTVLAFRFVGCTFDPGGTGEGDPPGLAWDYDGAVLGHEDLVAYWQLGEPEGASTAADSKGAHDGTYESTALAEDAAAQSAATASPPVLAPGAAGLIESEPDDTSLRVDGGYVEVPFDEALNPAEFSIEAWVVAEWEADEVLSNGSKPYRAVCSSRGVVAGGTRGFTIYAGPTPGDETVRWQVWVGDGGGTWEELHGPPVELDQLTYLAATCNGAQLKLYVNGSEDTDGAPDAQMDVAFVANTSSPFYIGMGAPEADVPQFPFKGRLQKVALYSAPLDPTVIDSERVVPGMTTGP